MSVIIHRFDLALIGEVVKLAWLYCRSNGLLNKWVGNIDPVFMTVITLGLPSPFFVSRQP